MELDKRIMSGKKPLTCFDVKEAKQFIGKECYFSNYLCNFNNINSIAPRALLHNITEDKDASNPYYSCPGYFAYCLPCEWVKEPEKKYRPFTLAEWIDKHRIGDVVQYRSKSEGIALHHMYVGYAYGIGKDINEIGVGTLTLGVASYSFDYLFEDYELFYNGRWLPFGVIDEDKE